MIPVNEDDDIVSREFNDPERLKQSMIALLSICSMLVDSKKYLTLKKYSSYTELINLHKYRIIKPLAAIKKLHDS